MKFLFWLLALFAAAVALVLSAKNPGYVLLVYPPYRIELSLTLFMLGFVALLILTYNTLLLVNTVLHLPDFVRNFRKNRALSKGQHSMMIALTAYFEGRYAVAEKAAVQAMQAGEKSGLNPIIAARAAHELREFDKRDQYLAASDNKSVGESTMRLIAKTEFLLDQKQPQLALDSLKELNTTAKHKHIGALQLELKALQQVRNWDGVLNVITQLEKRSAINEAIATQLRQQAWVGKLGKHFQDLKELQGLWKSMPTEYKQRPQVAALASAEFIKLKDCKSAQSILTESLNKQWDSELVTLYGDCQGIQNVGQIEQAEKWLKAHGSDAGLLLALGKLCLHQSLWGKAQNYLDASISLAPSRSAYTALAQLSEKLQKEDDAYKYYQLAMTLK